MLFRSADADANADARSVVMTRMQELSDRSPDLEVVLGQLQTTSPVQQTTPEPDEMATDVAGDEQLPQSVEEGSKYKCTCHPGDPDPDCPVHGLEPMEVGDALDVKKGVAEGQCNMTEAGEYCPKHGLEECGIMEYTGNWTNFGLEESDALSRLKTLAHGK